jgi:hypothetical protein
MTNQISFLGEFEFQTISTLSPTSTLARVWPTTDLFGFETENGFHALIVGFAKLVANSFTVAGGYRECFIFPFFASGASFGRALCAIFPGIPTIPLACLSFAAGINAGITRTSSYRTCYSHHSLFPCWRAEGHVWSIGSFTRLTTTYMPFIGSQQPREDLQTAMYSNLDQDVEIDEEKVPLNADA